LAEEIIENLEAGLNSSSRITMSRTGTSNSTASTTVPPSSAI